TEQSLVEKVAPGKMEPLPADFKPRHVKEMASVNDAEKFLSKDEYVRLAKQVRANALNALESLPTADLAKPATGVPPFCKTVGDTFMFLGAHWLMHAGQWAVIRRSIGKPPLF
ncbi:MAG: DinB family protein, partial [Anaerolineae bacterium]|nr:DinB family protein [Phycisphaerae bacterium]